MLRMKIDFPDGRKTELIQAGGITFSSKLLNKLPNKDFAAQIDDVRNMSIRDDDIYLATFPKSGTHWVWEILVMLKRGTPEYETKPKEATFLDFNPPSTFDDVRSPRVLNCHYPCKLIPRGILEKKNKIVHVMRNPKDVFVSFYYHLNSASQGDDASNFHTFLPQMLGEYGFYYYYSWYKYVKEWERFTDQHPGQILNLYFEDLKEDPVREIKKINRFLGTGRSDDLIKQIAEACDFENLKKADTDIKVKSSEMKEQQGNIVMYRKGQVGDWKNHFTVAENEKVDRWLEENLVDTKLMFRYTL